MNDKEKQALKQTKRLEAIDYLRKALAYCAARKQEAIDLKLGSERPSLLAPVIKQLSEEIKAVKIAYFDDMTLQSASGRGNPISRDLEF